MTIPDLPIQEQPAGLVAGRGVFPLEVCRGMRRCGVPRVAIVAVRGDARQEVAEVADSATWIHAGQLSAAIRWFRKQRIERVVFAGQITPGRLFGGLRPDMRTFRLLRRLAERNAESIFSAVCDEFSRDGIEVLPSTLYMGDALAPSGQLTKREPTKREQSDIEFGLRVAREVSRLDIGQTVVVKRGTVLAVEGFEGTDQAIRRGGELGRGKVVVVKVAKPNHDMRFDVPCVGMTTVESLRAAGATALAVHAGQTLLLEKATLVESLTADGIAAVGVAPLL
ncbi:MAG: LpxI family protein [Verrucomicrobiota bacterium]